MRYLNLGEGIGNGWLAKGTTFTYDVHLSSWTPLVYNF